MVRLIQVGLGGWGQNWATTILPASDDVEVVAWVDRDPDALAATRRVLDAPADRFHTSLTDAMATHDADAVLATVAISAHTPVALEALRAGKHVLVEKPFAPSLSEAAEILDEADRQGVVLSIAENYRFFPAVEVVADLVRAETLGPVNRVRLDFRRMYRARVRKAPIDHAILVQIAIHHFDVMRAVLGQEPTRVSCHAWNPPWSSAPAPVSTSAVIEFDGGAVVTYSASMASTAQQTPWGGEWWLECERGEIAWSSRGDGGAGSDFVEVRPIGEPPSRLPMPDLPAVDRAGVLAGFAAAVRDGTEPPSPGYDNIRSVALMSAAIESAETGTTVEVARVGRDGHRARRAP